VAIPDFRPDGYLPEGIHLSTEDEVAERFGEFPPRRRYLFLRVRQWLILSREVGAYRFLLDGSFVTKKPHRGDVDAVVWLPGSFSSQVMNNKDEALELIEILTTRRPEELFAAEDNDDWNDWVDFFRRTREPDGRRKGLVEIQL
jgi:hypothetical protein